MAVNLAGPHPIELKVKAASLAAEARVIRRLEKARARHRHKIGEKALSVYDERTRKISDHRRVDIRIESRATHLARAFINGRSYSDIEEFAYTAPPLDKARLMIQRYGYDKSPELQRFAEWEDAARAWYDNSAEIDLNGTRWRRPNQHSVLP